MSAFGDIKWDALPPRKKSKPMVVSTTDKVAEVNAAAKPARQQVVEHQQILDNIESRVNTTRAVTTLESKDGCAGDNYEYLDHTADVQCHTWGATLIEAFQTMAPCMLNYMTDIALVDIVPDQSRTIEAKGHDMHSLLFCYMDEILFEFSSSGFCTARAEITKFDKENFIIEATLHGESFDVTKHTSGTEIKAITYSNMQVHENEDRCDVFVIVDI